MNSSKSDSIEPTRKTSEEEEEDLYSAENIDDWIEVEVGDGPGRVCWQSLFPLLISGLGSISAGLILNMTNQLTLIKSIPFVAVVPPIQGMKGNLDLTFTSRLTTMAHKGQLDEKKGRWKRILRNIALLEGQAIVFSQFVMLVSYLLDLPNQDPIGCSYNAFVYLGSASVLAVSVSCTLMTFVMLSIVFLARHLDLNPDNLATPFASSLGDLLSLGLMLGFAYLLNFVIGHLRIWACYVVVAAMLCSVPLWFYLASKDKEAAQVAKSQWLSLLIAAVIASGAGALLEWANTQFQTITAYQPLISGIAGNRAALIATRISTNLNLHKSSYVPLSGRLNPMAYYITFQSKETRTARMLLLTSTIFQTFFVLVTHIIGHHLLNLKFEVSIIVGYLIAAFVQVMLLIYVAQLIVYILWKKGFNPDNHAIPLITSLGDLFGTTLLVALFFTDRAIFGQREDTLSTNSTMSRNCSRDFEF